MDEERNERPKRYKSMENEEKRHIVTRKRWEKLLQTGKECAEKCGIPATKKLIVDKSKPSLSVLSADNTYVGDPFYTPSSIQEEYKNGNVNIKFGSKVNEGNGDDDVASNHGNVNNDVESEVEEDSDDDDESFNRDSTDDEFSLDDGPLPDKVAAILNMVMFKESGITVEDVFHMIQAMYLKFNLSKKTRQTLLQFVKVLAGPSFESLNLSEYYMKKFYKRRDDKTYTFFCGTCEAPVSESIKKSDIKQQVVQCTDCFTESTISMANKNYFITIDIEHQLNSILSDNAILQALVNNAKQVRKNIDKNENIKDIHDGELFRTNKFIRSKDGNEIVLTLNINTDGAAVFKNTKYSLWTILISINELPFEFRFKIIMVAGALYIDHEPNFKLMNLFMRKFFISIEKVMNAGFKIRYGNDEILVKIFMLPLTYPLDSVARPIVAGRIQFNGYDGCHWCDIHGCYEAKSMRYPALGKHGAFRTRSHEQFLEYAKESEENKTIVKGVRGMPSICVKIPHFDSIWGYPIEYMHGIIIGVVKQLWEEWNNTRCKFYLTPEKRKIIDDNLSFIRATKEVYRLPEILKKKGKWKAADWLFWLLFYSVPCLATVLDDEAFASFLLLVKSINSLLSRSISEEVLRECEENLGIFVKDCERMYGLQFMTFNVHSLSHLCDSVRKSGPLWATSTFPAESKIGKLKKYAPASKGVVDQISDRISEKASFDINVSKMKNDTECYKFCTNVMANFSEILNYIRSDENAVIPADTIQIENNKYHRCIFKSTVFNSVSYAQGKRTNNSMIILLDGTIAQIEYFFFKNNSCFARVTNVDINEVGVNELVLDHMFVVTGMGNTRDISINEIDRKVILIELINGLSFVSTSSVPCDVQ